MNRMCITAAALAAVLCISGQIVPHTAMAASVLIQNVTAEDNGSCGDNVAYELASDGTLTIRGSGEMTTHPWDTSSVKKLIVEPGITAICSNAFEGCSKLTEASLPDTLIRIGQGAFRNCNYLSEMTLPSSLREIGGYAFYNCASIRSLSIPSGVEIINTSVFQRCRALTTLSLPDTVTRIGDYAFCECGSLSQLTLPDSVTWVGTSAFSNCSVLYAVQLSSNLTYLGSYGFYECPKLTHISLPESLTVIDASTFAFCTGLQQCTIPSGVSSIGGSAFSGCTALQEIAIPASVQAIADRAFLNCSALQTVYYSASASEWNQISIGASNDSLYAAQKQYDFTGTTTPDPPQPQRIAGDIDSDGVLTVADAVLLSRLLAEDKTLTLSVLNLENADCDGQSGLTLSDVMAILRQLAQS